MSLLRWENPSSPISVSMKRPFSDVCNGAWRVLVQDQHTTRAEAKIIDKM